jgi:hypothetical protein
MTILLPRGKRAVDQAVDIPCGRALTFHEHILMCDTTGFLSQFRSEHLLHIGLATQVGYLGLRSDEGV